VSTYQAMSLYHNPPPLSRIPTDLIRCVPMQSRIRSREDTMMVSFEYRVILGWTQWLQLIHRSACVHILTHHTTQIITSNLERVWCTVCLGLSLPELWVVSCPVFSWQSIKPTTLPQRQPLLLSRYLRQPGALPVCLRRHRLPGY
jgi:hypothetical protein